MSLYRKYRPHDFENLIGQEAIKTILKNAIKQDKISHAYLLCGPRGTGKTTTARLIAKAINCQNLNKESGEHCNVCVTCKAAQEGSLVDLIEIDAASNRGIDEIRDLREKIRFAPTTAKAKVYIIDEVHMLTKEAFNALLKTLEEPPAHAYFILATTETHKVPATIISRCQKFNFQRISLNDIVERLKIICDSENISYEIEALEIISKISKGGLRDAISILDQIGSSGNISLENTKKTLGLSDNMATEELFESIIANNIPAAIEIIKKLYSQGTDLVEFTRSFLEYVRNIMLMRVSEQNSYNLEKILVIINKFSEAKTKIASSITPELPLEIAIIESGQWSVVSDQSEEKKINTESRQLKANSLKTTNHQNEMPNTDHRPPITDHKESTESQSPIANRESLIAPSLSDINSNWDKIIDSLNPPSLKQTIKQSILDLDGNNLTLLFATDFHFEKFNKVENIYKLEEALNKILTSSIKINCKLAKKDNLQETASNDNFDVKEIFESNW